MYNGLYGALPLVHFPLLRPDYGRAALPRFLELAANVRLRASAALGAMLGTALANPKRERCFLPTTPSCQGRACLHRHVAGGWRHRMNS